MVNGLFLATSVRFKRRGDEVMFSLESRSGYPLRYVSDVPEFIDVVLATGMGGADSERMLCGLGRARDVVDLNRGLAGAVRLHAEEATELALVAKLRLTLPELVEEMVVELEERLAAREDNRETGDRFDGIQELASGHLGERVELGIAIETGGTWLGAPEIAVGESDKEMRYPRPSPLALEGGENLVDFVRRSSFAHSIPCISTHKSY